MRINEQPIAQYTMAVGKKCGKLSLETVEDSQIMLLGGECVGKRYIYWNFVASSQEKIAKAKQDWQQGPGEPGSQFPKIPHDDREFIPLPVESAPKGTVM